MLTSALTLEVLRLGTVSNSLSLYRFHVKPHGVPVTHRILSGAIERLRKRPPSVLSGSLCRCKWVLVDARCVMSPPGSCSFLRAVLTYVDPVISGAYPASQYEGHDHTHDERVLQRPGSPSATGNLRGFDLTPNSTILPQHSPYALRPTLKGHAEAGRPFRILFKSRIACSYAALRGRGNMLELRGHPAVNLVCPYCKGCLHTLLLIPHPQPVTAPCFIISLACDCSRLLRPHLDVFLARP